MKTFLRPALLALALTVSLALGAGRASAATLHHTRAHRTTDLREKVVKVARKLLGTRYVYGGSSPRTGFDCSGFVRFVYRHVGFDLPHSSYADFGLGHRVYGKLRPGDLVFFHGLGHVGIFVGHGKFIHAPHTGTRVSYSTLASYAGSYDGARRLLS